MNIKGAENIPYNRAFIICANHSSFIDIPCLYVIFQNYFVFTGKKEIEKWPLFKIFYTSGMNILVDRNNSGKYSIAFKRMMEVLEENIPLVIFPEGTISPISPSLCEFKTGAVSLAIHKKVPILPITFTTNWKRLQKGGFFKGKAGPGIAQVIIHPLIDTKELSKKDISLLNDRVKETISTPLYNLYTNT
ncbi:MAG: 1-acyl-sn-glycerol-3-phosphate acyltransferase [Sphingobacteriaceae bacterium]|nr:1-acyl-sn-glycerol-3-phosphate acyltransferase [Sphingobacteriaceae bacterium]